jgi:hypothetical protein
VLNSQVLECQQKEVPPLPPASPSHLAPVTTGVDEPYTSHFLTLAQDPPLQNKANGQATVSLLVKWELDKAVPLKCWHGMSLLLSL